MNCNYYKNRMKQMLTINIDLPVPIKQHMNRLPISDVAAIRRCQVVLTGVLFTPDSLAHMLPGCGLITTCLPPARDTSWKP